MAVSPSVLGKVVDVFERNFRERGEIGASISIWWDGAELTVARGRWASRGLANYRYRFQYLCFCPASLVTAVEIQVRAVEEPYLRRTHGAVYEAYCKATGCFVPRSLVLR